MATSSGRGGVASTGVDSTGSKMRLLLSPSTSSDEEDWSGGNEVSCVKTGVGSTADESVIDRVGDNFVGRMTGVMEDGPFTIFDENDAFRTGVVDGVYKYRHNSTVSKGKNDVC